MKLTPFNEGFCATWIDKRDGNRDVYVRNHGTHEPLEAYCFGSACPCGNDDGFAGCANSTGAGARLYATGTASVASDDLVLRVSNVIPSAYGILFVGEAQACVPFGDGLRAVAPGATGYRRFPVQLSSAEGTLTQGPGLVAFSSGFSGGGFTAGETWFFQAFYRDVSGPCGNAFNVTNGLAVTFGQ